MASYSAVSTASTAAPASKSASASAARGGLVLAPLGVLVDAGAHGQNECDGNCNGAHDEHRSYGVEHGFEHHANPLHEQAAGDTGNTGKGQSHE